MTERGSREWGLGACALVSALLVTGAGGPSTPEGIRGVWTAERSTWRVDTGGTTTLVQLSLRRAGEGRGSWNSSHPVPLAELEGLTTALMDAASADVRFAWKRDAGTFGFEGRFQTGAGAGHFTFTPSPAFIAEMRSRGYGDLDDEKDLTLAIHDVSRAFLGQLAALGYERVPMDKLIALRIHGASPEFIRGLAGLGYQRLPLDQLVALRIHGASLEFIRDIQGLGFAALAPDQLVAFRIHGVDPDFIRAFRSLGYDRLTPDELVSMRIHGVTPEFVTELKALGYSGLAVDVLVTLRIHGVTTEFVRRVQGRAGKA
ncbi:MAG TPA: hypothetical protein VN375_16945, partial [Vicinamibacteria bacterium]|nr:hypothetical protein [Vicinamibacteria bacterium]